MTMTEPLQERIAKLLRDGGSFNISHEPTDHPELRWSVMGVFGREAPDSPMAGGAVNGCGETIEEAVEMALKEARL